MKSVKAKTIETEFGSIYAAMGKDKLKDGREINSGAMFLQIHCGECTLEHEGKKMKLLIGLSGMNIVIDAGGRKFVTDCRKMIEHAIDKGLLDSSLRFDEAEGSADGN